MEPRGSVGAGGGGTRIQDVIPFSTVVVSGLTPNYILVFWVLKYIFWRNFIQFCSDSHISACLTLARKLINITEMLKNTIFYPKGKFSSWKLKLEAPRVFCSAFYRCHSHSWSTSISVVFLYGYISVKNQLILNFRMVVYY